MANNVHVAIRISEPDRDDLRQIALRLCDGNQSQAFRMIIREVAAVLREQAVRGLEKNTTNEQPAN